VFTRIGLYRPPGMGRCGLCGQHRKMTEAHVPPRGVGNGTHARERAQWVSDSSGARLGPWKPGGLSVYGLCTDCNNLTSDKADPAYIDFHNQVQRLRRSSLRRLLPLRDMLPARVAPRLVARSVLVGMCAINDRLQEHFPTLAKDLQADIDSPRLSEGLQLRLALTDGPWARIGGPVGYMRVLTTRQVHMPLAEVWYPPLAWCLRSLRAVDLSLGPDITSTWGDVSEWIRYSPDLTTDLRNVVGLLPIVQPLRFGTEDWVVLKGDGVMTALEGRSRSI
jgi:hypothetical protein